MNINNATQSNVSHINNKTQVPAEKPNASSKVSTPNVAASADKVTLSNSAKVSSHLQSLPAKQQAEIKNFINGLDQQAGNTASINNQIKQAPEVVKKMAEKLNMGIKDIASAMPTETVSSPAKTKSKGVAAYSSVAAQSPTINNSSLLNTAATKSMTAKTAIA